LVAAALLRVWWQPVRHRTRSQAPLQEMSTERNGKKQFFLSIPHDEDEAEAFLQGRNINGRQAQI
jgi:hypothetical protein